MTRSGGSGARALVIAAAALMLAALQRLARELSSHDARYGDLDASVGVWLLLYRWLAIAFVAIAVVLVVARWGRIRAATTEGVEAGHALRAFLYIVWPAFTAGSLAYQIAPFARDQFAIRSVFFSTLLLAGGIWLVLSAEAPRRFFGPPSPLRRAVDIACMNLLLFLGVAELGVSLYSRMSPTAMLWNEGSAISTIEANRFAPGKVYLGTPMNSGGYHDAEFFRAGERDLVIALVADSFGVGAVPYRFNYATVAEERLKAQRGDRFERVAVHNFGIVAIGMPEYAWLVANDVERWNPRLVVLSVFIGNDIYGFRSLEPNYYNVQNLKVYAWIRRTLRVLSARRGSGESLTEAAPAEATQDWVPAWVRDPDREPPTMDEKTFMEVELSRVKVCDSRSQQAARWWREFFEALDVIHDRLGNRLRLLLIPDEFQVNDVLWNELMERVDDRLAFERDRPQDRIRTHVAARGIPVLDLLPALRQAGLAERVYHLRDTHWNAAGNQLVGDALASFLLAHPLPDPAPPTR